MCNYFKGCITEIRRSPFGREARQPIAGAIESSEKRGSHTETDKLKNRFAERVNNYVLTPLPEEDYYQLQLVRANGH